MAISDAYVWVDCDQAFCSSREEVGLYWRSGGYDDAEQDILDRLDWGYDLNGNIECENCKWDREAKEEEFAEAEAIETENLKELYW